MRERPGRKSHFSISETSEILGRPVQTLHYWLRTRRIRLRERTSPRGNFRIPRAEIVRLLKEAEREVPGLWERDRRRALLIDDDRGIRAFALAAARAARSTLTLRTAADLENGLLLAAQFKPQVLLIDAAFPKGRMQGDQGLAFIRGSALLRKARVVVLVDHPKTGAALLRRGADAVLLKPFGLSDFREALLGGRTDRTRRLSKSEAPVRTS